MRLLGILLVLLGVILKWLRSINPTVAWTLIIVGVIIVLVSRFLKPKAR